MRLRKAESSVPARRRRLRIGTACCAVLVAVTVLTTPTAAQGACPPDAWYINISSLGDEHINVGPNLYVRNENPTSIQASFTSQVSGTVTSTASYSGSISGGVNLFVLNADVSNTFSISTSVSITTQVGIQAGPMTVPAYRIQWANYGVNVRRTKGTFGRLYSNCSSAQVAITLAKSPTGVGWRLWQTSI